MSALSNINVTTIVRALLAAAYGQTTEHEQCLGVTVANDGIVSAVVLDGRGRIRYRSLFDALPAVQQLLDGGLAQDATLPAVRVDIKALHDAAKAFRVMRWYSMADDLERVAIELTELRNAK
jgi:hypothetical protein